MDQSLEQDLMTPCATCTFMMCQRRDGLNIPKACLARKDSAKTKPTMNQFAYMGHQEKVLRAGTLDSVWDGGGGSY
jgi:hypothetical protein